MRGYAVGYCLKGNDPHDTTDFRAQHFTSVPQGDLSSAEWEIQNLQAYHAAARLGQEATKKEGGKRQWYVIRADSDDEWLKQQMMTQNGTWMAFSAAKQKGDS